METSSAVIEFPLPYLIHISLFLVIETISEIIFRLEELCIDETFYKV